jgi:hypothetical protein
MRFPNDYHGKRERHSAGSTAISSRVRYTPAQMASMILTRTLARCAPICRSRGPNNGGDPSRCGAGDARAHWISRSLPTDQK